MTMHRSLPLLAAAVLSISAAGAEIHKIPFEGKEIYRLSNDFLEADVFPAAGGRIVRLFDKSSGANLTPNVSSAVSPGGTGMMNDRVAPSRGAAVRNYEKSPYQVIFSRKAADGSVSLTMKCDRMPLNIEKKITLKDKEARITVSYALTNPGEKPFVGRFWQCSIISPDPKAAHEIYLPEGSRDNPEAPARKNHITYIRDPKASPNHFIFHPKQDFAAVLTGSAGAVIVTPFEFLDYFYSYTPAEREELPTVEWFTLPFQLNPFSEAKKYALTHPEDPTPLENFIYRFDVTIEPVSAGPFQYDSWRRLPQKVKTTRFKVNNEEAPLCTDFSGIPSIELKQSAKPLRIMALVNVPAVQELAELNRRIKQDLRMVEVGHPHQFVNTNTAPFYAWRGPDPNLALENALKSNPDVILLSGTFQKSLPKKLCHEIVRQVKNGATAVYISPGNQFPALVPNSGGKELPVWVTAGIPWKELPVGLPKVREYPCGKGRVVHIPFKMYKKDLLWTQGGHAVTPRIKEEVDPSLKYWEYYFSFYGRVFRYLSGTPLRTRIKSAEVKNDRIELEIDNRSVETDFLLRITFDEPGKTLVDSRKITLQPGKNSLSLRCPGKTLPEGLCFCNLFLDGPRETADWLTVAVRRKSPNRIESLETERYQHRGDAAVKGKLRIAGKGDLILKLLDYRGRVMAHRTWKNASGTIAFSLKNEFRSTIPLARLKAILSVKDETVSEKEKTVTLEPLPLPRLQPLLFTSGEDNWITLKIDEELASLGFLVGTGYVMANATESEQKRMTESMMSAGMRFAPMSMHPIRVWSLKALLKEQRDPCMRNPEYGKKIKQDVEKTVSASERYFPARYFTGDENSLGNYSSPHEFCRSPWCLAGFRNAMRVKYGSLESLNRIWKTSFRNWDDVLPLTLKKANASNNPAPWFEHRLYMMNAVSDVLGRIRQELEKAAPGAKLGVSGQLITGLHSAFNWIEAMKYLDGPTAYIRDTDGLPDLMRSCGRPDFEGGAWIGYGQPLDIIRFKFWNQIMNGLFSPSYWWSMYFCRRGDRKLSPEGEHMRKTLAEIRESGIDKMFAEGNRMSSRIAIVYSIPSLVITGITGAKTLLNQAAYTNDFSGWAGLVRDMGFLPPDVVSSSDLISVTPEKYPVLILPLTQVLSQSEADALRKYVEAGGFLVADSACGLYRETGVRRPDSPLADLFGVKAVPRREANAGTVMLSQKSLNVIPAVNQVAATDGEPKGSIQTMTAATQFGNLRIAASRKEIAPAAIRKSCGKGQTLYLNFLLNNYPTIRTQSASSLPVIRAMRTLFAEAGHAAQHDLPPGSSLAEYEAEGNRYVGLTRLAGDHNGSFTLRFDREYEVYDTIRHRYLGRHRVFRGTIGGNDAALFALLPRKIKKFEADVRFDGRRFQAEFRTDDVNSIVRIETRRDGLEIRDMTGNWNVRDKQKIPLEPGLEPAGNWTFRITNLFTGEIIKNSITLKETANE